LDTPLCSLKCPLCRGLVFQSQIDPSWDSAVVGQRTSVDRSLWWSRPWSISQIHVRSQSSPMEISYGNRRWLPSNVGD
jgi:hypothetical protein